MVYTLGPSRRGTLASFLGGTRVPGVLGFDPLFHFMHELDAAESIVLALEKRVSGVFNVAGPQPVPLSLRLQRQQALPQSVQRRRYRPPAGPARGQGISETFSQGFLSGFAGADPHDLFEVIHKHLAVTDLAGARRLDDGVHAAVYIFVLDHHFHLDFGQKVNHVLGTPVQLGVAFLTAKTFDFGHGQACHAAFGQGFTHLFQFERFDDGGDLLHGKSPLKMFKTHPQARNLLVIG
jgi:hypothetical protein